MEGVPGPACTRSSSKRADLRSILRFDKLTVPRKIEGQPVAIKASYSNRGAVVQPCPQIKGQVDITLPCRIPFGSRQAGGTPVWSTERVCGLWFKRPHRACAGTSRCRRLAPQRKFLSFNPSISGLWKCGTRPLNLGRRLTASERLGYATANSRSLGRRRWG